MHKFTWIWTVAGGFVAIILLLTWLVVDRVDVQEAPQETAQPVEHVASGTIRIYAPMAGNEDQGRSRNPSFAAISDFADALPMDVRLEWVPVRRAFQQFTQGENSCIYDMQNRGRLDAEGHLLSQPLSVSRFWLYGRIGASEAEKDRRVAGRRVGTITGAELFFDPTSYGDTDWVFASSYEALIAMLESGRVDAVTLGPGITQGVIQLPKDFVRLNADPFLTIHGILRCKDTPEARALMEAFRTGWGRVIDNN